MKPCSSARPHSTASQERLTALPIAFPPTYYVDYLNTPSVQQAIGAYVNFSESSNTVGNAFASTGDDDREAGTIEDVKKLLKQGVYVVEYYGDAD